MKINKFLILLLFICILLEVTINNLFWPQYELQLILDVIFAYFIINREDLIEKMNYKKSKIFLFNFNNLIILFFMYIEAVFSSNLIIVNILFIFALFFIVLNENFPDRITISFISILIIYFTVFFVIKDYFSLMILYSSNFYVTPILISRIISNIVINILLVIILNRVFRKILKIKFKE